MFSSNKKAFLGIILIIMGLFWILFNFRLFKSSWFLPIIGLAFLASYLYRGEEQQKRPIGFLITGCIITMIGLFCILNDNFKLDLLEGPLFFFFLGVAFLPIYLFHTRQLTEQDLRQQRWPLTTGFSIIGFGLVILVIEAANTTLMRKVYPILIPVLFILLGFYIIFFYKRKSGKPE